MLPLGIEFVIKHSNTVASASSSRITVCDDCDVGLILYWSSSPSLCNLSYIYLKHSKLTLKMTCATFLQDTTF